MSLFKNLFGNKPESKSAKNPSNDTFFQGQFRFGRYADAFKPRHKTQNWDKSRQFFEDKKYVDAFEEFFHYLRDDEISNVNFERKSPDHLEFSFYQGSRIIKGEAGKDGFQAETFLASFNEAGVAFMRKLMNINYALQYCRFAIKDDKICMKFDSQTIDASPSKLYFSLKELALQADKQDDLLISEFGRLKEIGESAPFEISEVEKKVKIRYFRKWIEESLQNCDEMENRKLSGAVSYILLSLIYRIDFLITPEGEISNRLEKISGIYFAKDNRSWEQKNAEIKEEVKKLKDVSDEELKNALYRVKSTFGIVNPTNHKNVYEFILKELPNTDWYIKNGYTSIALHIYEYICSYCLFNYGMCRVTRELMLLLYQVLQSKYFEDIKYDKVYYDSAKGTLASAAIQNKIRKILKKGQSEYPLLNINYANLRFNSIQSFAHSFLNEITYLNFSNK